MCIKNAIGSRYIIYLHGSPQTSVEMITHVGYFPRLNVSDDMHLYIIIMFNILISTYITHLIISLL